MKSTPLCWVGVGEDKSGPDLVSKGREGTPSGHTVGGEDGLGLPGRRRDEEGFCQALEGRGRAALGQARNLRNPGARRDWSSGRGRASGEKRTEPPRKARARALLAARP